MNYLIGAISGNYSVDNIKNWVNTSNFDGVQRVLFSYNQENSEVTTFCRKNNIWVFQPDFDFQGLPQNEFIANSGLLTSENAHSLIHHVRFLHYSYFLRHYTKSDDNIIATDVTDIIFTKNPFYQMELWGYKGIIASSEEIYHGDEEWNKKNYYSTFGFNAKYYENTKVYNAGLIAGTSNILIDLFTSIYLFCLGKPRNADQAAYNYLIQTAFRDKTKFTHFEDYWGLHLHVIVHNNVKFDLNNIKKYNIIHQYDRLKDEIQHYYTIPG